MSVEGILTAVVERNMNEAIQLNGGFIEKQVGNGGSSGIIYVPREYIGTEVKVILSAGDGELPEIVEKVVGKGVMCGVIYVHKKNLGKTAKIVFLKHLKTDRVEG